MNYFGLWLETLGGAKASPRGLERKNPKGTNIGKSQISDIYLNKSYLYNACHIL